MSFHLLMDAPILAFHTETGLYVLDTDASNFGLGGVLSQVQNNQERAVAYCSQALQPSQRRYCTTKREMLAAVALCIQFRSYLRGARFTLRTDHKSLVWLHRFKDTEGMMSRWLHALQQFQFSIVHRPGKDHSNADGLSRAPSSPCRQCTRPDCPLAVLLHDDTDQPFDSVSTGSSEDADLVPVQSGEDWIARPDNDLSQPVAISVFQSFSERTRCAAHCIHGLYAPRTPFAVASPQQFVSRQQRYLVVQENFTEPPLRAIGPQGRPGTVILVLPHFLTWWSPGKDPDPS